MSFLFVSKSHTAVLYFKVSVPSCAVQYIVCSRQLEDWQKEGLLH